MALIFVDVEADFNSPCPGIGGGMTEFGAVEHATRKTFHGKPDDSPIDPGNGASDLTLPVRERSWRPTFLAFEDWLRQFAPPLIFVSDNPAYDWQWINYHFHHTLGGNPFGHSARRIGDFYAGLTNNFRNASKWKKLRVTPHTHNPVDDAMGNAEAFERMLRGERA